ncbi:MAG TPA: alpha-amylase family glycosyl hydrolase [Thermoanaerobaculia bacterium]|nr:alpha-amylase family glycosyl hydrolase [Thermoanaerobaculia bacterium]
MRTKAFSLVPLAALVLACAGAPPAAPPPPAPAAATAESAPVSQWDHEWARGAVFYEVFVRSFSDSDGNGIGDFPGLTAKLDYLKDLGVDALWLMPVFDSPSYHGYDTVDYEKIEPDYGTSEDFNQFLGQAHRRGIRVIVDLVMNHSSAQHPWFVDSASSPSSAHRDWYVWRTENPGWTQPFGSGPSWHEKNGAFYYGVFWSGMPDLNFSTPAVRQEMERLANHWIGRGVDGFRLDATRHLFANGPGDLQNDQPETHEFLKEFAASVRQGHPQAVLVGENWTTTENIARYFGSTSVVKGGDELPMSFNFPLAEEILGALSSAEAAGIGTKLEEMAELYPQGVIDAPFLTNHDHARLATQLGNDPAKMKSAAAILLTLPGAPFLYYGEEVGLQNGSGDSDEFKRTPMPWDASPGGGFTTGKPWFGFAPGQETANVAAETSDPGSLLSHYRSLIRLRKASPALKRGTITLLSPGNRSTPVLAFLRETPQERVLVVHNVTAGEVAAGPYDMKAGSLEPIFGSGAAPVKGAEGWTVRLPAGGSGVWRVR